MKNRKQKGKARKSEKVIVEGDGTRGREQYDSDLSKALKKKRPSQKKAKKIFQEILGTLTPKPPVIGTGIESLKVGDTIKDPPLVYAILGNGGCAPVINSFKTPLEENVSLAKRYIQAGYRWNIMDHCDMLCFRVTMFKAVGPEVRGVTILFGYRDYIWWGGGIDGLSKKLKEVEQWFAGLEAAGYNTPKPEEVPYQ